MSATTFTGANITGTSSIKTIGGSFMVYNSIANPLQKFSVDSKGNLTASGDVKYNGTTSLTTQMATLNGYKTTGSISGTTSFQTIYNINGNSGFIIVFAGAPNNSNITALFCTGANYCLTQIASAGNANQTALNTTNAASGGTCNLTIQQLNNTGAIQAKVPANSTISWQVFIMS